jgi:hypothetical protein
MTAEVVSKETLTEEQKYADSEYRRFLKELRDYKDFDEFCREEKI